jgi:hypothetical protein
MLGPWREEGCSLDVDKARQIALQKQAEIRQCGPESAAGMSESLERKVSRVIDRARKALVER